MEPNASRGQNIDHHAVRGRLADLNRLLAAIACSGDYNLKVVVGDFCFFVQTESGRLRITLSDHSSTSRATVAADSQDVLKLAVLGGRSAALSLMARQRLRVEGETAQLEELARELMPHSSTLEASIRALAASMSNETVLWVPNDEAFSCMSPLCRKSFSIFRRRHHCRRCGRIFCRRCAPVIVTNERQQRTCVECAAKLLQLPVDSGSNGTTSRQTNVMDSRNTSHQHSPLLSQNRSNPAEAVVYPAKSDLLLECHLEESLYSIRWWQSVITASSVLSIAVALYFSVHVEDSLMPIGMVGTAAALSFKWWSRYLQVIWVCIVIAVNVLHYKYRVTGRSQQASAALWEMCHRLNARFIYDSAVSLSGFWVKMAQSASVNSALPDAYGLELAKLQDGMPPSPFHEVEALLAAELGKDWKERVRLHSGPPLGSATIAQVHRATLCLPGEDGSVQEIDGVVKVQRQRVKGLLLIDVYASQILATMLEFLMPHLFANFRSIVKELAAITMAELDFRVEAESQDMARAALVDSGLNVVVPKVYHSLVTPRVLAMEYIDGVKISEMVTGITKEDRQQIVSTLIDYYGFTMQGPVFNCDPHPGNLLVERKTGRLCVLDWGQAKRLEKQECLAYGKLLVAILSRDSHLLVEACETIGFSFGNVTGSPDVRPVTMIGALRFLMRDSKPVKDSRTDFDRLNGSFARLSGELKAIQSGGAGILKGALLPFSKTVDLLHQVSTRLDASLPLLHILACRAYPAILRNLGYTDVRVEPSRSSFKLYIEPQSFPARSGRSLNAQLGQLLQSLHSGGHILGAQLVVLDLESDKVLADIALGHTSWLKPTPVTADTMFNIKEISKLFLGLAVLRLVDNGLISLDATLSHSIDKKVGVTLEHALSHTAGLFHLIPEIVTTFSDVCNVDQMAEEIGDVLPLLSPGCRQQYHHFTYGWLLARACRQAGVDVRSAWADFVRTALGIEGLGALSLTMPENCGPVAEANLPMESPGLEDMAIVFTTFEYFLDLMEQSESPNSSAGEMADAMTWKTTFGKRQWLEPTALQSNLARTSVIPGVQAFATARSTAQALRAVARGKVLQGSTLADAQISRCPPPGPYSTPVRLMDEYKQFENSNWGLGLELLQSPCSPPAAPPLWGHTSTNGSFTVVFPRAKPLVASLLLNCEKGNQVAEQVLKELEEFSSS